MNEYININNNININPYKLNSLSVKKNLNLQRKIGGIKNGISRVQNKIGKTDKKIKNIIKRNISRKIPIPLKLNMSSEMNNQNKSIIYQYSSGNSVYNNQISNINCFQSSKSTNNILHRTQGSNINNINNFNFNNNIFSKSSNNFTHNKPKPILRLKFDNDFNGSALKKLRYPALFQYSLSSLDSIPLFFK